MANHFGMKNNFMHHNEAQIIKRLRQQIPVVQCIPDCHDCCNDIILFTDWEWSQIKNKRIATTLTCPYLGECGCGIYHQRPIVCRLYGTSARSVIKCKHGCLPIFQLSEERELGIYGKYIQLLGDDMLMTLQKSVDLESIVKVIDAIPDKKSVTGFVERLPDRWRKNRYALILR